MSVHLLHLSKTSFGIANCFVSSTRMMMILFVAKQSTQTIHSQVGEWKFVAQRPSYHAFDSCLCFVVLSVRLTLIAACFVALSMN